MFVKFGALAFLVVTGACWATALWRMNEPGIRLFHTFAGLIVIGPFPLLLLWLVEYGHLPAYHEGYALLIPGGLLLMLAVAFIGDVFNL